MSDKEWQDFCQKTLAYWWRIAKGAYGTSLKACPTIHVSKRMTRCAGLAYWEKNEIAISHKFLSAYPQEMRDDTIPHELAHIIAYQLTGYGDKPGEVHGKPWKEVCLVLTGKPLSIYHNYV